MLKNAKCLEFNSRKENLYLNLVGDLNDGEKNHHQISEYKKSGSGQLPVVVTKN